MFVKDDFCSVYLGVFSDRYGAIAAWGQRVADVYFEVNVIFRIQADFVVTAVNLDFDDIIEIAVFRKGYDVVFAFDFQIEYAVMGNTYGVAGQVGFDF